MGLKIVKLDMWWKGQQYAICDVEIPDATKHTDWVPEAVHVFGRPALDDAISRWSPAQLSTVPYPWNPDEPIPTAAVPLLTVWERLKSLATRITNVYARELPGDGTPTGRWRVQFRRDLIKAWWIHHGNGRVVQLAGGTQKTKNIADLAHVFLWDRRNRNADYAMARADIHKSEQLVREEAERETTNA